MTLKAGLIGYGSMGRNHARVLNSLDGVTLVGVADPAFAQLRDDVLESLEQLLALHPDYCVVATPTAFHEEVALRLAEAGVHALIEKPLAPSGPAALRIAEAFEARGLIGAVGHIERYNPALQEARKRMAAGQLGEVLQIATRRQGPFPARIADVGVVKDLATHDIDLTAWIAKSAFESVAARTTFKSGRQHEDMVSAVGVLEDGTITNHLVNWLSPFKERVTVITGERGALVADTLQADLTFYANGTVPTEWDDVARFRGVSEGDMVRYAIPKPEPLRTEHEQYRDALMGLPADIVTMRDGLNTVRVADALLKSSQDGSSVKLSGDAA